MRFAKNADGTWASTSGGDATLEKRSDGTWVVTTTTFGEVFEFPGTGTSATAYTDASGKRTTYAYNSQGVTTATDNSGVTTFSTDSSRRIHTITGPTGRVYTFTYNAAGLLDSVSDPDQRLTRYEYDASKRLTAVEASDGQRFVMTYVGPWGARQVGTIKRVTDRVTGAGDTTTFQYFAKRTTVTRPDGSVTHFFYDPDLRMTGRQNGTLPGVETVGPLAELADTYDNGVGSLPVRATGADVSRIRSVTLLIDGQQRQTAAADCTSSCPYVFSSALAVDAATLGEGQHTAEVRALADDGETGSSGSWNFTIDRVAPTTPTGIRADFDSAHNQAQLRWSASSDPPLPGGAPSSGVVVYEYRTLESGVWTDWQEVEPDDPAWLSAAAGSSVTVEVRSRDVADNVSAAAQATLTVGAGPPPQSSSYHRECPKPLPTNAEIICYAPEDPNADASSLSALGDVTTARVRNCSDEDAELGSHKPFQNITDSNDTIAVMNGDVVYADTSAGFGGGVHMKWRESLRMVLKGHRALISGSWKTICGPPTRRAEVRANLWRDTPFARRQVGSTQPRVSGVDVDSQSWSGSRAFNFKMGEGVNYRVRIRFDYDPCCWPPVLAPLIITYRIRCGDVSCKYDDDSVGQPPPR